MKKATKNLVLNLPLLIALAIFTTPLFSFIAAGYSSPNGQHDPKTELHWLVGTWEDAEVKGTFEKWEIADDTLKGKRYKVKKDKEVLEKTMFFTTDGEQMYYHSITMSKKTTEIETLKHLKSKDGVFVFGDTQQKYPEYITFTKVGANEFVCENKFEFGDLQATATSKMVRVE